MRYSRLMAIAKSYKKKEIEYLSSFGNSDLLAEAVTKMDDISDKLDGYKLSEMNFFELTNIGELELVKAVVNHRISSSKKISNDKFKEIANQYDKYVISWRELANDSDANKVFYSLAYFTIEWKYAFNFLHHCVKEMEKAGVKDEKVAVNKIGMLLGYRYIMSILGFHMSIDSRMVGYREGLIADFLKNPEIECQYREMLALLAAFKENMSIDDIPIKDWFVKNTNVSDWASFFNEYDVFKSYESSVNWTGKHIGTMRKMYAEIFPENPENRSYKSDFDFDTIMISNLKEELNMDKFECYIEEYQNEKGQLCARIRDKKSNKRVEMIGETFVYNHFLRFLSQAKINIDIMPTVYDRNGNDIVSVRETKQSEDDECIVVGLIGSGAGYVFE